MLPQMIDAEISRYRSQVGDSAQLIAETLTELSDRIRLFGATTAAEFRCRKERLDQGKPFEVGNGIAKVPLSKTRCFALIDATDIPIVEQYSWYLHPEKRTYYAWTSIKSEGRHPCGRLRNITVQMGRMIMGLRPYDPTHVDHINHDGFDNRRSNLRFVTPLQNCFNRRKRSPDLASSRFKGVSFYSKDRKWIAQMTIQAIGRNASLGYYDSEVEAALAYKIAVDLLHKSERFYCTPIPDELMPPVDRQAEVRSKVEARLCKILSKV